MAAAARPFHRLLHRNRFDDLGILHGLNIIGGDDHRWPPSARPFHRLLLRNRFDDLGILHGLNIIGGRGRRWPPSARPFTGFFSGTASGGSHRIFGRGIGVNAHSV